MAYEAKDYNKLIGMQGFSTSMLSNHFKLYQGYVTNTNKLMDTLGSMTKEGKAGTPEYAELKRRFGFEFDGMRVHEYYFGNLGGTGSIEKGGEGEKELAMHFGSYEAWEKDFRATGSMRGVGWAILYQDDQTFMLFNKWINEHHVNHPAGCRPILVMDVWEHAFMLDYQLNRAGYIDAFFKNINWQVVTDRIRAGKAFMSRT